MIIKGRSRTDGVQLAGYLLRDGGGGGNATQLLDVRGMASWDLERAFLMLEAEAEGTRCSKPFFHAQISPDPSEQLTPEQQMEAVRIHERHLGFDDQPRAVVLHDKDGRQHLHVVWGRIDRETRRARRDDFTHKKNVKAAREIEERFDLRRVESPFKNEASLSRRERRERSKEAASYGDYQQAARADTIPADRKAEITALWRATDNGSSLRGALEAAGYTLAIGDRRDFVVVDPAGEIHSLARQIEGARVKDVRARLSDIGVLPAAADIRESMALARAERLRRATPADSVEDISLPDRGPVLDARPPDTAKIVSIDRAKLPVVPDVLEALTERHSTFTDREMTTYLARQLGDRAHPALDGLAGAIRAHAEFVALGPDRTGSERYTSRAHLELELRMEKTAAALSRNREHGVRDKLRRAAPTAALLSSGQKAAFEHITGKEGLSLVVGYAGTGKSTMLGAAREAWEAQGLRVVGASLSGIAAESLQNGSGISSRTIHSLLYRLDGVAKIEGRIAEIDQKLTAWKGSSAAAQQARARMHGYRAERVAELKEAQLGKRDVLVIDEAGMIGSKHMERLLSVAAQAGAKVVLVGDAEQLQAIDAGGAFRALRDRHGAAEITEIRRQRHEWQREATTELAGARTDSALARYHAAGHVHETETTAGAIDSMVAAWTRTRAEAPGTSQIMLAYTKVAVAELNEKAREAFRAEGRLGRDIEIRTAAGDERFAAGDRLYFTKNDARLGVRNGTLATIETLDQNRAIVRLDSGERVKFYLEEYNHITHGYAATVHKSQGVTVDRAHVLASRFMDRHAAYVGLSRHREQADLYYAKEDLLSFGRMSRTLSRDRRKDTTLDYLTRVENGDKPVPGLAGALDALRERFRPAQVAEPQPAATVPADAPRRDLAELFSIKTDMRPRDEREKDAREKISLRDLLRRRERERGLDHER